MVKLRKDLQHGINDAGIPLVADVANEELYVLSKKEYEVFLALVNEESTGSFSQEELESSIEAFKAKSLVDFGDGVALTPDVSLEIIDGESVLFDPRSRQAHHLNTTATRVVEQIDNTRSQEDIVESLEAELGADAENVVAATLVDLQDKGLLASSKSLTRREFALSTLKVAVVAPMIASVLAPAPVEAGSLANLGQPCSGGPNAQGTCVAGCLCTQEFEMDGGVCCADINTVCNDFNDCCNSLAICSGDVNGVQRCCIFHNEACDDVSECCFNASAVTGLACQPVPGFRGGIDVCCFLPGGVVPISGGGLSVGETFTSTTCCSGSAVVMSLAPPSATCVAGTPSIL